MAESDIIIGEEGMSFSDVDWARQEEEDEAAIAKTFDHKFNMNEVYDPNAPIDQTNKADDAEDFEDFDDDDLPDEEEPTNNGDVPGLTDDMDTSNDADADDLFGEGGLFGEDEDMSDLAATRGDGRNGHAELGDEEEDLMNLNFPNYSMSNQDLSIPEVAATKAELVKQLYPSFEKYVTMDFNRLLPPKKAFYVPKAPVKPPKVLNPTKVSLDLAVDQEKLFRAPGPAITIDKNKRRAEAEARGLVAILEESELEEESEDDAFDFTPLDPNEKIAGTTMASVDIACANWYSKINALPPTPPEEPEDEAMDDWEKEFLEEPVRKRKAPPEADYINAPHFPVPDFDNFENMTAQIAKSVVIDLNDRHLLVEEVAPVVKRRRIGVVGSRRAGTGNIASVLQQRFNFANDEVYDAMKEARASKVRATLSNMTVEHSLPALKLQWPYYKVRLGLQELRSFHRPSLKFAKFLHQNIMFSKPGMRKRKEIKKLNSVQEIFGTSKDLSLSEVQATATLFEYSEEHPNSLSNFGMGNRVINYYRRKDANDNERPTPDDKIGDTTILLPEDKSPFANFGFIQPGETVRAIQNGMYRAPIFKHEPRSTDFLVIRNSTGVDGSHWYLRNIDNIFTVGQQFPTVEVPGPHSRKYTNAGKNRIRMLAYRMIRHSPHHAVNIGQVTNHIEGSTVLQNRQKLKEFVHYNKSNKLWTMHPGEMVPDEASIRAMVKPEEICLIDTMQVGVKRLEDVGLAADEDDRTEGVDKDHLIEKFLAPWRTSKAFLEASTDKAMLKLEGEGDPSGCGQAFSMIKVSMKGGFLAERGQATSAEAMEQLRKQNGGHQYNVKAQAEIYDQIVRGIWQRQKDALSSDVFDEEFEEDRDDVVANQQRNTAPTPRSMATPAAFDDSVSQFSTNSRVGKVLRITRTYRNKDTGQTEEVDELVRDPHVIREYLQRRLAKDRPLLE